MSPGLPATMSTLKKYLVFAALFLAILGLGYANRAQSEVPAQASTDGHIATSTVQKAPKVVAPKLQTPAREAWLAKLELCESGGRPGAINPKDRDNTPSYGLLQFKPSTFAMFAKAYRIDGELMDPDAQRAIVRRMMDDPSIRWSTQFPDCVKKLGLPPA